MHTEDKLAPYGTDVQLFRTQPTSKSRDTKNAPSYQRLMYTSLNVLRPLAGWEEVANGL